MAKARTPLPPGEVDPESRPIGVGRDYKPPAVRDNFGFRANTPKPYYFSGDQREIPASLGLEDRADIKFRLKALGLLPKGSRTPLAVWDDDAAGGFKEVLAWANARGMTWQQALEDMEDSALSYGGEEEPIQARAATNPLDFRAMGDQMGRAGIGRGLTDREEEQFASAAAAFEAPSLNSDSTVSGPGAAGWEKWAEGQVREIDPLKFDARKVARYGSVIAEALRGGTQ